MDTLLFPWEGLVVVCFFLALIILYTVIRWVFRPRPKGRFPLKRLIVFLACCGLIYYAFQAVDDFPERLRVGLRSTGAFTTVDTPQFEELRTRYYAQPPQELFDRSIMVINQLGWRVRDQSSDKDTIHARISRFGFWTDEFLISFVPENGQTRVDIQSRVLNSSTADLGANRRHIVEFYQALERELGIADDIIQ